MHIEYYTYFHQVAMIKSISKAANDLHISQSALSQQLQKMEENLGYKLLTRSNKGVKLTDEGRIVLKYGDYIIRTYNKMLDELENIHKNREIIKIEAPPSISTYFLPNILFRLKNRFKEYEYELVSSISEQIKQDVANNICNIGVVYGGIKEHDDKLLSCFNIGEDKLVLVSHPKFDITDEISSEDIIRYPLIVINDEINQRTILKNALKKHGKSIKNLNVLFCIDSIEAAKFSVMKGYGISFLPYSSVKKQLNNKKLKIIELKGFEMKYPICLVYNNKTYSEKKSDAFMNYFKKIGKKSFSKNY